jgi:hypothetical protein
MKIAYQRVAAALQSPARVAASASARVGTNCGGFGSDDWQAHSARSPAQNARGTRAIGARGAPAVLGSDLDRSRSAVDPS